MEKIQFHNKTLVVADTCLREICELASRAAQSNAPVLICGESGTGKELIARLIHEKSKRVNGPFVSVNCAAIPEGLLEAELFGYERGAFTGALARRIGKFEQASGGTLLLDELSEMPLVLQAKLLRVLQESEIDRLGGAKPIKINSRIIATTNKDPLALIQEQHFRQDLYYRLNVIRIDCVPLRGRVEAIRSLVQSFLVSSAENHGLTQVEIANEAMSFLCEHSWPGNIRELQNAIERAVLMSGGDRLTSSHFNFLKAELPPMSRIDTRGVPRLSPSAHPRNDDSLSSLEQQHILTVLESNGGNRTHAAKQLGISIRTLRNKLKTY